MLSATRQKSSRLLLNSSNLKTAQPSQHLLPKLSICLQDSSRTYVNDRAKRRLSDQEAAEKAAKKIIKQMAQGSRGGLTKKPSRGFKEQKEIRDAVLGYTPAHQDFQSQAKTVFSTTESRPEDLEAPGPDEGELTWFLSSISRLAAL
ncbi:hypothetical protein RhiJN_18127 [Ceratobasidium sp. AG-Ba]|nr:hypothetical protein RhiJN_18127 [Ceratobasidium sp. AG-Ba]